MSRPRVPARHVVLVTGSREWCDAEAIAWRLRRYPAGTLGIHGGGPARNALLVDLALTYVRHGYTVAVEAFPTASSRGTWDCVDKARNAGLPVQVTRG